MADLFQEIMDDMKGDRFGEAWNKHGRFVIYAAIAMVMITAAIVYWNHHQRELAMEHTSHYITATDALEKGDAKTALAVLDKIRAPKSSDYYSLVLLAKAQSHIALGDKERVDVLLAELAGRSGVYGDIGKMMKGVAADEASPLRYSREEWSAWNLLESGKTKEAAALFAKLGSEEKAPVSLRDRAQMMALHLQQGEQ